METESTTHRATADNNESINERITRRAIKITTLSAREKPAVPGNNFKVKVISKGQEIRNTINNNS